MTIDHSARFAPPVAAGPGYRADVDGLRGIAVAAVALFHAYPTLLPGGYAGVDVFFVVSGWLITRLLVLQLGEGGFSFAGFYAARVRRLVPALLPALAALLAFGWVFLLPQELAAAARHALGALGFVSNFVLWSEAGYFDAQAHAKPLMHLWSLAVEEQFYLLWPAAVVIAWHRRWPPAAIAGAVLALSLAACLGVSGSDAAFYSPATRAWEFMAGALLALAGGALGGARAAAGSVAGLCLLAAAFTVRPPDGGWPGPWTLLPVAGTLLLIACGNSTVNRRLLAAAPLVWLGWISYSLYLWHWLVLFANAAAIDSPPSRLSRGLALAASVVLATLSYLLLERPSRARDRIVPWIASGALVALACGALWAAQGVPQRMTPALRELLAIQPRPHPPEGPCSHWDAEANQGPCAPLAGRPLLVVWGDSHAARLGAAVAELAGARYDVRVVARAACPPLPGFHSRGAAGCAELNARVLQELQALKPAHLWLHAYWSAYPSEPLRRLAAALPGTRVQVVGPPPRWHGSLPRTLLTCSRLESSDVPAPRSRCGLDDDGSATDGALRGLSASLGMGYGSVRDVLCDATGCLRYTAAPDGGVTARDHAHLTPNAARLVARELLRTLP